MPILRAVAVVLCALSSGAAADDVQTPVVAVQAQERPTIAAAQPETIPDAELVEPDLAALLWVARPLVIFADTPSDPRFDQQMREIEERMEELDRRRVIVLTDTDPAANGPLRRQLRPRGFGLVLIDTDGTVIQRRPSVTTVRELSGTIDRLPSRRDETGSRRP